MSTLILTKIAVTRRKHVALAAGAGIAIAIGLTTVMLGVEMLLDWWVELPLWLRAFLLAVTMALCAYVLVRHVLAPLIWSPDDDEVALWVEQNTPAMNDRLIASVQLTRAGALEAGASAALVREMVHQAESIAAPLDFAAVVKPDRFVKCFSIALLTALAGAGGMLAGGGAAIDLLKRAFLVRNVDVPRKTRVELIDPVSLIARGDPITLRARALGILPEHGTVEITYAGTNQPQRHRIEPDPTKPNEFALTVDTVQSSFQYVVFLNDGRSAAHAVEVAERPAAAGISVRQIYPAYTGLGEQVRAPGDLSLLAGSTLNLDVLANKSVRATRNSPPFENRLHLFGSEIDHPLQVDPANTKRLSAGSIPIPAGTTGFSIHLTDERGLTTKDPAVYRIELVPDRPPALKITSPAQREELVTRRAQLTVALDAGDDYGLAKLSLCYRVITGNGAADPVGSAPSAASSKVRTIELNVPARAKSFRGYYPLKIPELSPVPAPGQAVEWWIEAEDANDVTGPGKTSSERYLARVVTDEEKRADLMSRLGNYLGEINEVSETQRDLSATLGELITEKK